MINPVIDPHSYPRHTVLGYWEQFIRESLRASSRRALQMESGLGGGGCDPQAWRSVIRTPSRNKRRFSWAQGGRRAPLRLQIKPPRRKTSRFFWALSN